ncbi:MAG: PEP-CTERM sorting domain-containing protein [Phycisphaera sp.]|nr:MAG: PEP-CTERM sorting domain-containing protein [Phycisphaera sp.]
MRKTVLLGAVLALAGTASAQSEVIDVSVENFGNDPEVVLDTTFDLPAIASIDMVSIDLAHSWGSDIEFILTSPAGDIFTLTDDNGSGVLLGDGGSLLAGTARYDFVSAAGNGNWNDFAFGDTAPAGTYDADSWNDGPFAAGTWGIFLADDAGGDDGAAGRIVVEYTIPAPASLALLGLGGLAAARRRR